MDKLKNFIEINRADFEEAYPLPEGHEARFMGRLEEEKPMVMLHKSPRSIRAYLLYATAMAAYNTRLSRLPITLRYQATMPLVGAFFAPDYGELY